MKNGRNQERKEKNTFGLKDYLSNSLHKYYCANVTKLLTHVACSAETVIMTIMMAIHPLMLFLHTSINGALPRSIEVIEFMNQDNSRVAKRAEILCVHLKHLNMVKSFEFLNSI